MSEPKWTDEQLKEKIAIAIEEAASKIDTNARITELETTLASLQAEVDLLKTEKQTALDEKEAIAKKLESEYVLASTVDEKIKTAVAEAIQKNERYHVRIAELTDAKITLDKTITDRLMDMSDPDYEFMKNVIAQAKSKKEETVKEEAKAEAETKEPIKNDPLPNGAKATEEKNPIETIGRLVAEKIKNVR